MYCALLLTGIVITSEKPFKFLANGSSFLIDVKIYPNYEDYKNTLDSSRIPVLNHFSFNRDKAVAFWQN